MHSNKHTLIPRMKYFFHLFLDKSAFKWSKEIANKYLPNFWSFYTGGFKKIMLEKGWSFPFLTHWHNTIIQCTISIQVVMGVMWGNLTWKVIHFALLMLCSSFRPQTQINNGTEIVLSQSNPTHQFTIPLTFTQRLLLFCISCNDSDSCVSGPNPTPPPTFRTGTSHSSNY